MPDLGKATYSLILDTRQLDTGLAGAEARVTSATNNIAARVGAAGAAIEGLGGASTATAAQVEVAAEIIEDSYEEVAVAAETAAGAATAGGNAVAASAKRMATASQAAAAKTAASWRSAGVAVTGFGTRMSTAAKKASAVGHSMRMKVTLPVVAAGGVATKMAYDFDQAFTDISALVGASDKELKQYKTSVLQLSGSTAKAPQELADALYFVTSAGFKGASAIRVLDATAKASAAGLGNMSTVADAVTSSVNAYGEKTLSANKATDILLATVREGKAEPEALAGSIGRVIPVAESMGITFNEVGGSLAAMTLSGLDAAEATTAVRGIMLALLKPSAQAEKTLARYGTSAGRIREEIRKKGLFPVLMKLRQSLSVVDRAKVFDDTRAMVGFLNLTGANAKKNEKIIGKLNKTFNDTDKAIAKVQKTDEFKIKKAINDLRIAAIKLGHVILPVFTKIVEKLSGLIEGFNNLAPWQKKVIGGAILLAAAIGPLVGLFSAVAAAITGVGLAMGLIYTHPITAALLAIGIGLTILYKKSETFRRVVDALSEGMVRFGKFLWSIRYLILALVAPLALVAIKVVQNWSKIKTVFGQVWDAIKPLRKIASVLATPFKMVFGIITAPFRAAVETIRQHWNGLRTWLGSFLQNLNMLFTNPLKAIKGLWKNLVDGIKGVFTGVLDFLKRTALKMGLAVVEPFTHLPWKLGEKARQAKEAMLKQLEGMKTKVAKVATDVGNVFSFSFFNAAIPGIQAVGQSVSAAVAGAGASAGGGGGKQKAKYMKGRWVDAETGKPLPESQAGLAQASYLKKNGLKSVKEGTTIDIDPNVLRSSAPKPPKTPTRSITDGVLSGMTSTPTPAADDKKAKAKARTKVKKEMPLIPIALQLRETRAQQLQAKAGANKTKLNKALKLELNVLRDEEKYLLKLRSGRKLSGEKKLAIEREILTIDRRMAAIGKELGGKIGAGGVELWTPQMRIRLAKAQRTDKNLKDDLKVLQAEENYLKRMLKNRKLTKKQRAAVQEELTRVHKQLLDQQKKIKDQITKDKEERDKTKQLAFSAMQERSSFFSSFAPNVFVQQANAAGGVNRTPGSAGSSPQPGVPKAPAVKPFEFAKGGIVPGVGGKDKVPALLTPGEAVLSRDAVGSFRDLLAKRGQQTREKMGMDRPNVHLTNHQHFQAPPTKDGAREARYAEIAMKSVFEGSS